MTDDLFKKALKTWGQEAQLRMAQEECAELIHAISKFLRKGTKTAHLINLIDEIADVKIMISQLEIIVGQASLEYCVEKKLQRLRKRLNE